MMTNAEIELCQKLRATERVEFNRGHFETYLTNKDGPAAATCIEEKSAEIDRLKALLNSVAEIDATNARLMMAMNNIKNRTAPRPDDTLDDDKRDKRLAHAIAQEALR